ncbi:MAG: GntR family transcriptional regulator [Catenisphaera adipataccumulans]|jgi:DNA-binding GntR family transcriptional regulator|uniref:GntR family transcriptional regulator n=1 Tax=Catenisphaera adipataccumulans TaxID=700500 RepID=UPI003D92E664
MTKFIEIYHRLANDIRQNLYVPYTYLPAENELMKQFDVSRDTVRKALGLLAEKGYIQKRRGKGSMVLPLPFADDTPPMDRTEETQADVRCDELHTQHATRTQRTYTADGETVQIETIYQSTKAVPAFTRREITCADDAVIERSWVYDQNAVCFQYGLKKTKLDFFRLTLFEKAVPE